jgi:hypothetical protein
MQDTEESIYENMDKLAVMLSEAEAERVYISEFRKSKKAILMKQAEADKPGLSAANQQTHAYAHPEYIELLEGLKHATEKALLIKHKLKIIEMKFEAWRSKNATRRAEMNLR